MPLDRAGRRLPGWSDRLVRTELHYRWCDLRLCLDLAVNRGGMAASRCLEQNEEGENFEYFLKNFFRLLYGNRLFDE